MQLREKFAYALLVHFSALMIVFLLAGIVQLVFGPLLMEQLKDPVISAMVNIMRTNLNYPTEKLLIGMITFIFFIPLDLAILYFSTRELFEKGDIFKGIEEGIRHYPLFIVFISNMYFFSFTYPWFAPVVLYVLLRYLEPNVDWRTHVISTAMIGLWFLPLALVGRIEDIITRNVVSFLLYLGLVFPFFVHAWIKKEGIR